tara:strand:- start:12 stop:503 length:492 start_codon:yes stop_codon:yes gene_type:complete
MKIFGLIGWKNSGKTYFAQQIIQQLFSQNLRIASIKHADHNFDIDQPNTDSFLHRQSGSQQVIISSSKRWAKMVELKNNPEKKLEDLISELDRPDIVIVEGFKNENHPKIEIIHNSLKPSTFMFPKLKNIVALISDTRIVEYSQLQFKKNEIKKIVQFILNYK